MFTGIIEETGTVAQVRPGLDGIRLAVRARVCARGLKVGDSVAVNGCCLTVVKLTGGTGARRIHFDLLRETWNRTSLKSATAGALVNLERSLPVNGRLGGHFVTGHVDATGRITRWEKSGTDHLLEIAAPPALMKFVIEKGSIALDGISLTVAAVRAKSFRVWIIPHTLAVTALRERQPGDAVNLEADLLGKYVARLLTCR